MFRRPRSTTFWTGCTSWSVENFSIYPLDGHVHIDFTFHYVSTYTKTYSDRRQVLRFVSLLIKKYTVPYRILNKKCKVSYDHLQIVSRETFLCKVKNRKQLKIPHLYE